MIKSEEISVIVQGAINKTETKKCLKSIRKFLPDAEIILSTWENSDVSNLNNLYDIVIFSKDPGAVKLDLVNNVTNNQNRQLVSTKEGVKKASRKYILKLRSDFELQSSNFLKYWNKFSTRNEKFNLFRHRVMISSVFSRFTSATSHRPTPFHASDFFLFGLSEDLKDYFASIRLFTNDELGNWKYLYPNKVPFSEANFRYAPEQFFLLSYVKQFFNVNFDDCSDWNLENIELSNNILYNNFIFLDFKQSGIYSKKHSKSIEYADKIYGLISYKYFQEQYKNYCDKSYHIDSISVNTNYVSKLHKHFLEVLKPVLCLNSWFSNLCSVIYYAFIIIFRGNGENK